jgi:hypothetical protein
VPSDFNPADHFLDVISVDYRTPELTESTKARIEKLVAGCHPAPVPLMPPADRVVGGAFTAAAGIVGGGVSSHGLDLGLGGDGGKTRVESGAGHGAATAGENAFWVPFTLLLARTWREQTRDTAGLYKLNPVDP